jgi:hydrogenase-4 component B
MTFLAGGVLLILSAGAAIVAFSRWPRVADDAYRLLFAAGCIVGAVPAARTLGGAEIPSIHFTGSIPGGPWFFGVDALSGIFLLAIFGVGGPCALYGVTYFQRDHRSRRVRVAHVFTAVLIAALALVVTARAAVPFLISWEVMAVAGFVLIVFEHESAEVRRAGLLYLVATHAGTLALFGLFAAWSGGSGDLSFAALAERAPFLAAERSWILVLALAGFGVKAGLVPLHFWLPEAHAAAPSHISALLSGVVIKMGIYGLFRVTSLLGAPPVWWGWLLLGLGASSGVLGVVWALGQHDLKRLLAFHSVENIGIILLGLGAGTLGLAYGHPAVAVLGYAGAALHTFNHALFKSLLFLGAGSLAHGTGTRDMERLGGIARRMPGTAIAFLIGSVAIVGLPPLNGFLSEWLVLRSLLEAGLATDTARLAVLAAVALGLIGALALACFAKVVGIVFLGVPRNRAIGEAHESPAGMMRPLYVLAGSCIVIGLLPTLVLPPVMRVGALVAGGTAGVDTIFDGATRSVTLFAIVLAAGLLAFWSVRSRLMPRAAPAIARAETWSCGYAAPTPRMQYTASSFAAPILGVFGPFAGIKKIRTESTFATHAIDPVLNGVVLPAWRGIRLAAESLRPLQRGPLSLHLLYLGATVVALLLYLLLSGRTS